MAHGRHGRDGPGCTAADRKTAGPAHALLLQPLHCAVHREHVRGEHASEKDLKTNKQKENTQCLTLKKKETHTHTGMLTVHRYDLE